MGAKDIKRQQPNVRAIKKNGAEIVQFIQVVRLWWTLFLNV